MASIVSSLTAEHEVKLQKLISRRVRFHLLYKSSHHGAGIDQLLEKFDHHGKFLLCVFPSVKGLFMSESLGHGKCFSDNEGFVFRIEGTYTKRFPSVAYKTNSISVSVGSDCISVENLLTLTLDSGSWYVSFSSNGFHGNTTNVKVCCEDVELHRVQDVNDILPNPWREVVWQETTRENLKKDFASYKLLLESLPRVKALLLGPVGSGKSSFINSVKSTMYNRVVLLPNIGTAVDGFTRKMTTYNIRVKEQGSPSVLSLCDVMPLGEDDSSGLSYADALAVIKGHVPDGYKFQKGETISDTASGYITKPTLEDQIHCVLFVLNAFEVASYPNSLEATLRKLRATISEMGIPQLVLLTHVDQVCLEVQKDLKDVYYSQPVLEKMQKAAMMVGLPLSYVLPVKNYISTLTVDCNTDVLLLSAVINILHAVNDSFEEQYASFSVSSTPKEVVPIVFSFITET